MIFYFIALFVHNLFLVIYIHCDNNYVVSTFSSSSSSFSFVCNGGFVLFDCLNIGFFNSLN